MARKIRNKTKSGQRLTSLLLIPAMLLAVPLELGSESLMLSTTYPSPAGVYNNLIAIGKLGIGTGSPIDNLHIIGANPILSIDHNVGNAGIVTLRLSHVNGGASQRKVAIISNATGSWGGGNLHLAVNTALDLTDATLADSQLMISGTTGNVGIGTTAPGIAKTYISNPGTNVGLYVGNGVPFGQAYIEQDGPAATHIWVAEGGAVKFNVTTGGDVMSAGCIKATSGSGTTNGTCVSDERLKKNIHTIIFALDKINKLRPVSFEWKKENFPDMNLDEGTKWGLIAQDVEKVLPEMVSTDGKGYKRVTYGDELRALMLQSIKELSSSVDQLKTENQELRKHIQSLEEQLPKKVSKM